jgi:hypothetical protein
MSCCGGRPRRDEARLAAAYTPPAAAALAPEGSTTDSGWGEHRDAPDRSEPTATVAALPFRPNNILPGPGPEPGFSLSVAHNSTEGDSAAGDVPAGVGPEPAPEGGAADGWWWRLAHMAQMGATPAVEPVRTPWHMAHGTWHMARAGCHGNMCWAHGTCTRGLPCPSRVLERLGAGGPSHGGGGRAGKEGVAAGGAGRSVLRQLPRQEDVRRRSGGGPGR